eukprot:4278691-Pleurochrysis_carterae.AAC.1
MCALEWTASLLAWRHSSHAMLHASVDLKAGASRVHCRSNLMTSARRWLNRVCNTSAVTGAPLVASLLP